MVGKWSSGCSFLVVLADGPLRAWPATLLVRSRRVGALVGRVGVAGAVGGALLGLDALDGFAGPLPVIPLYSVVRLRPERQYRIGDPVDVSLLLDLGRGLPPGPPASGRLRHGPEGLQDIAGTVGLDGHAGGAPLPGQGPQDLPILWAEVDVGLQPAVAALLVLAQLPLPVRGAVRLLGGHRQSAWHAGRLDVVGAQPAKHRGWLAAGGLLVAG
jgi:hypothetical protein